MRRKRKPSAAAFYSHKDIVRLKPKFFNSLRENDDFIAMVRIGRVFNVLDYSFHLIANAPDGLPEHVQSRHRVRALWNCAGYLQEGIKVAFSIQLTYAKEEFFKPFMTILGAEHKKERRIMKDIRDSLAFHLDVDSKATKQMLMSMKLPYYEFYSETAGRTRSANFPFADLIDLNYLLNVTIDPTIKDGDSFEALMKTILDFRQQYVEAASTFIRGVNEKLGLMISRADLERISQPSRIS